MANVAGNINFALPEIPPGTDPKIAAAMQPLWISLLNIFQQLSAQQGINQTIANFAGTGLTATFKNGVLMSLV